MSCLVYRWLLLYGLTLFVFKGKYFIVLANTMLKSRLGHSKLDFSFPAPTLISNYTRPGGPSVPLPLWCLNETDTTHYSMKYIGISFQYPFSDSATFLENVLDFLYAEMKAS